MKCSERVVDVISAILSNGRVELRDDVVSRVNKLTDKQCEIVCTNVELFCMPYDDLSTFIEQELAYIDTLKYKRELDRSGDLWTRWDNGGQVSMKEFCKIVGRSESKVREMIDDGLVCYGDGKLYFEKKDWKYYRQRLKN